jgi:hypothetical protein
MNCPSETKPIETNMKMTASLASFLTGISYHGLPMMVMTMYKRRTQAIERGHYISTLFKVLINAEIGKVPLRR